MTFDNLSVPQSLRFYADTFCQAVTLTFDPLTLKFKSISGVMRLNFEQNFSEIEYSTAE